MPKYYCDYCDIYLTHNSLKARKDHIAGYKHRDQVRNWYAQMASGAAQQAIDAMTANRQAGAGSPPMMMAPPGIPQMMAPPTGMMPIPPGAMPMPGGNPQAHPKMMTTMMGPPPGVHVPQANHHPQAPPPKQSHPGLGYQNTR